MATGGGQCCSAIDGGTESKVVAQPFPDAGN
jgi:hypothetical protein